MARANARTQTIDTTEKDYSVYLDKRITPTQTAFYDWLIETVGDITELEADRIVAMSSALLNTFQASDWWAEHRDEYKPLSKEALLQQRIDELEAQVSTKSGANGGTKSKSRGRVGGGPVIEDDEPEDPEDPEDDPPEPPKRPTRGRPATSANTSKSKPKAATGRRGRGTEAAY